MVKAQARPLKSPGAIRTWETLARRARDGVWRYEEYLHEVLAAEIASRNDSAIRHRVREARFPDQETLAGFDFAASDGISQQQALELARCEWIGKAENVVLV